MINEHSFADGQGVLNYLQASVYAQSCSQRSSMPTKLINADVFTVAISREAGIDAGVYARAIGNQLGWSVWDHELLELIALRLRSSVSEVESLDERHASWIQESLEAFLLLHGVNQHSFMRHLRETIQGLAAVGNCIIVGRGCLTFFLPRQL